MAKLYIVPTPIGNLEDITLRALRILKEADIVLAEDTRTTSNLLRHYNISTKLSAYHKFNEHQVVQNFVQRILSGETVALVSDAGTPSISDPAFLLVRACVEQGVEVDCLPGATALIPALVNSGFPSDKFIFEGFLPHKKGRQTRLKLLAEETRTIVLYESPHRLIKALEQFAEYFGENRLVSVSREITKMYEETIRGTVTEVLAHYTSKTVKGEIVIVIMGKSTDKKEE